MGVLLRQSKRLLVRLPLRAHLRLAIFASHLVVLDGEYYGRSNDIFWDLYHCIVQCY